MGEDLYPEKINRLCANHPHNYYLEILTDTGSAGFVLIFIIGFLFIFFIIKNLKYLKENNLKNLILLSAILCLCLEVSLGNVLRKEQKKINDFRIYNYCFIVTHLHALYLSIYSAVKKVLPESRKSFEANHSVVRA